MAKNLDDYEFWLPSQFLTDDDLLMDFNINSTGERNNGARDFQHRFNPFGLHSDLNSPVESAVGSVDTECDEEEYITELTRKMAHSTLHDSGFGYQNTKVSLIVWFLFLFFSGMNFVFGCLNFWGFCFF